MISILNWTDRFFYAIAGVTVDFQPQGSKIRTKPYSIRVQECRLQGFIKAYMADIIRVWPVCQIVCHLLRFYWIRDTVSLPSGGLNEYHPDRVFATMNMTLPSLKTGEVGRVECVKSASSSAKRLADLGFVSGARLEMLRPGSPCIVRIEGVCMGLGLAHQACIQLLLV